MNIRRAQIWYIRNDVSDENDHRQAGERPWIVISNNAANKHSPFITAIPLTRANKKPLPTHCKIHSSPEECTALCEQLQLIDRNHLDNCVGTLSQEELENVEKCVLIHLGYMKSSLI